MSTISLWFRHLKRRLSHIGNNSARLRGLVILLGLATIPLVYAGLLSWANEDPTGRLDQVPAAIVNEDTGSKSPRLTVGDDLTQELLDNDSASNFAWREMSAEDASAALASGDVYAVLTIPASFSTDLASLADATEADGDALDSTRAHLHIVTDDSRNTIAGNLASVVAVEVTDTLKARVGDEYLKNIYAGFTTVHDSVADAAQGAGELSDGAHQAADGSGELVIGLAQLDSASQQLASGASRLASGASEAASAAARLNAGADTLASGARELESGTQRLADGSAQVNEGAESLSSGIGSAASGSRELADGLGQLDSRLQSLPQGIDDLKNGAGPLSDAAQDLSMAGSQLHDGIEQVRDGAGQVRDGAVHAHDGAIQLRDRVQELEAGASEASAGASAVHSSVQDLLREWPNMSDDERYAALQELERATGQVDAGVGRLSDGLSGVSDGAQALVGDESQGLQALADGASRVADGASTTADGARTFVSGAQTLADAIGSLPAAVERLEQSAGQLTGAVSQASSGANDLADGLDRANTGSRELAGATQQLAGGSARLADGAGTLSEGSSRLADGSGQLADGAQTLAGGTNQVAQGSSALSDGISQAHDGASELNEGLGELAEGSDTLHEGLEDGVDDIPAFSQSEGEHLADVAGDPVQLSRERQHEVDSYGYGLAPYFMSLSMWVGALGFFLMMNALNTRRLGSEMPAFMVAAVSFAPAAAMALVQSTAMVFTIHWLVGIEIERLGGALIVASMASVCFMAINQALNALLGPPGRYLALVFTVLQLSAAGATYPIETTPDFFRTIHAWLPMTHVVTSFRAAIAGGSMDFGITSFVLVGYTLVALAALPLAVVLKRKNILPS